MSARTHTRPHPRARGGVEPSLPWWALVLPAIAFVLLLSLILDPAEAQAASGEAGEMDLLGRIRHALPL